MAKILISTTVKQLLPPNPKRIGWELQFVPSTIVASNTGIIFLSVDKIPKADTAGENNESMLNAGSAIARNLVNGDPAAEIQGAVWAISDTASQQATLKEWIDPTL